MREHGRGEKKRKVVMGERWLRLYPIPVYMVVVSDGSDLEGFR